MKTIPSDLAACHTLIQEQVGVIQEQASVLNENTCLVETQSNTIDELHGTITKLKQQQEVRWNRHHLREACGRG